MILRIRNPVSTKRTLSCQTLEILQTYMQGEKSEAWPSKALLIQQPSVGDIFLGFKTWELRYTPTTFRGLIAIAEARTGVIVARARLTHCVQIVDADASEHRRDRRPMNPSPRRDSALYAWLLEQVVAVRAPYITIPGGLRKEPAVFINLPDGAPGGGEAGAGARRERAKPMAGVDAAEQVTPQAALPKRARLRGGRNRSEAAAAVRRLLTRRATSWQ